MLVAVAGLAGLWLTRTADAKVSTDRFIPSSAQAQIGHHLGNAHLICIGIIVVAVLALLFLIGGRFRARQTG